MSGDPWCAGKTPYPSKAQALDRIRHQKHDKRRQRGKNEQSRMLMPYRCTTCHQWHVGSAYSSIAVDKFGRPIKRKGTRP